MLSPTDRKLLGALLSRQEETGVAAELPSERIAEIAAGSPSSADEAAALLASPLAREELALRRRLRRLREVDPPSPDPRHPDTLASMNNPAFLYREPGRHAEAEALAREALLRRGPLMRGGSPPSVRAGDLTPVSPRDVTDSPSPALPQPGSPAFSGAEMDADTARRIRASRAFRELERRRNSLSWTLTAVVLAIYFGFISLVAFGGSLVATPISGPITLAFLLGIGVILSAIALTGFYVLRANTEFDELTRRIVGDTRPASTTASGDVVGVRR